jgi:hypothetical protein
VSEELVSEHINKDSDSYKRIGATMEELIWDSESNSQEEFSLPQIDDGSGEETRTTIEGEKPTPAFEWEIQRSPEIPEFHFVEYKSSEQIVKDLTGFENEWRKCPECGEWLQKIPIKTSYIRVDSDKHAPGNSLIIRPGTRKIETSRIVIDGVEKFPTKKVSEVPKIVGASQEYLWACRRCRYAETEYPEAIEVLVE